MEMKLSCQGRWFMVFNAPFNNISVSYIGGGTGVPGENHRPVASH